jgi:hypothetical protein
MEDSGLYAAGQVACALEAHRAPPGVDNRAHRNLYASIEPYELLAARGPDRHGPALRAEVDRSPGGWGSWRWKRLTRSGGRGRSGARPTF